MTKSPGAGQPPEQADGVPMIIRVAGLPAASMAPFTSERCMAQLDELDRLAAQIAELRGQASDRIYEVLPQAEPDMRRLLLALKRDCFNGRGIRKRRKSPHWPALPALVGDVFEQLAALEDEVEAGERRAREIYVEDRDHARTCLLSLGRDPAMLRALSLASQPLVENLESLYKRPVGQYRRRERKVELSLLRYLNRAAVKQSPYSTFTRIGLGVIRDGIGDQKVCYLDETWGEGSLLRTKRYLFDQIRELLFHHPRVRARLPVATNDTAEEIAPGQFRFLRPPMIELDAAAEGEGEGARYVGQSMVKVRLGGPLIAWLREHVAAQSMPYEDVVQELARTFEQEDNTDRLAATLDKLLQIGFLKFVPPWPSNAIHIEKDLLAYLQGISAGDDLAPVIADLEGMIALEQEYAQAANSLESVKQIDALLEDMFDRVKALSPAASNLQFRKTTHNYYEDVLVPASASRSPAKEILHLDRATAQELLRTGGVIWTLLNLWERRHEFHLALQHFMAQRWPERSEVPCLELFAVVQPLWEKYLAHLGSGERAAFDPYQLESVAALGRLREEIRAELETLYTTTDRGVELPEDRLRALIARIPRRFRPVVGPCLFTQPADPEGNMWVVNRFFEGNGRFSSRFTAVLDESMCDAYTGHFTRMSRMQQDGEWVEILDTVFTRGNTVCLHLPQTPRTLESPGEYLHLPVDRRCQLRDLVVHIDEDSQMCVVRDQQGQRYIPSFLTPLKHEFIPSILKFLDIFGPTTRGMFGFNRHARQQDGLEVLERLTVGKLVVRRQRWVVPRENVPAWDGAEEDTFLAINRWRRERGIPDQVYMIEKVHWDYGDGSIFKPQYIDFRSPAFVTIFRMSVSAGDTPVVLEEALPVPEAFPADAQGRRWGVEMVLESVAMGLGVEPTDQTAAG